MLIFNPEYLIRPLLCKAHLNTSHVNLQRIEAGVKTAIDKHLNTSHVNLQQSTV